MLPTYVIGKSKKPKFFGGNEALNPRFNFYYSYKKGWMNQVMFFHCLLKFDAYISHNRDRKVLLLMENAAFHGNIQTLSTLRNMRLRFLPLNTTSILDHSKQE